MTPLEELQAAHKRLSELWADSASASPWVRQFSDDPTILCRGDGYPVASIVDDADADLIVTLHRTIDAQLAFLQEAIEYHNSYVTQIQGVCMTLNELALARAINGGADV